MELEAKRPVGPQDPVPSRVRSGPSDSSVPDQIGSPLPIRTDEDPDRGKAAVGIFCIWGEFKSQDSLDQHIRNRNRCRSIPGLAQVSDSKGWTRLLAGTARCRISHHSSLKTLTSPEGIPLRKIFPMKARLMPASFIE